MSNQMNNKISPSSPGFFQDILLRIKLIYRLLGDKRVNPFLKLLPIGGLLYFIIPDLAIGPFDDAAVIGLSSYLFIELCPDGVVQEHMRNLRLNLKSQQTDGNDSELVIDAEFVDQEKDKKV